MSRLEISLDGLAAIDKRLGAVDKEIERAARNTINRALRRGQKKLAPVIAAGMGLPVDYVMENLRLQLAGSKVLVGLIIPSSAGVPVPLIAGWRTERIDATRARIYVPWVNGSEKLAAGFVNPSSAAQRPLRTKSIWKSKTRTSGKQLARPQTALAPSIAAAFKQMDHSDLIVELQLFLASDYEEQLFKQMVRR